MVQMNGALCRYKLLVNSFFHFCFALFKVCDVHEKNKQIYSLKCTLSIYLKLVLQHQC